MRTAISITAMVVVFSACAVSEDGYPLYRGYKIQAVASPIGAVYFQHSGDNAMIRAHELCHIRRMQKMGAVEFVQRYLRDEAWACREERICGWFGPHPMCEK